MDSAFGIDHGEFAKANYNKNGLSIGQRMGLNRTAGKLKAVGTKVGNAKVSINDVGQGAGKAVSAIGTAAGKRPGLTGAAVLGTGGYAAYRGAQNPKLPKRKKD